MAELQRELDSFIDPQLGAHVSCHCVSWTSKEGASSTMPSGGNVSHHVLPASGSALHSHEFAEIILVLSGCVCHCVNGERQTLYPNSLVFLRPTDQHFFMPRQMEKVDLLFLDFRLEPFLTLSEYFEDDEFLHQFTAPVMPPTFVLEDAEASELCSKLLEINSPRFSPKLRKVKAKVALAELFSRFFIDESSLLSESRAPDWLRDLCAAMRKPENFIPGLKRMRKLASCTPEHLCKAFRKHLNKSPTEFINELRASYAAKLLADGDEKIGSIACELNFQSLSRFYSVFRKHFGVTPKKYRSRARRSSQFI